MSISLAHTRFLRIPADSDLDSVLVIEYGIFRE